MGRGYWTGSAPWTPRRTVGEKGCNEKKAGSFPVSRAWPAGNVTETIRRLALGALCVLMISCSPKGLQPLSRLNTPEHHAFAGVVLLNQEKLADAEREFERALRLDPRYAKAHVGAGLVKAHRGDFAGGLDAIRQSLNYARTGEERIFAWVGTMRANRLSRAACFRIDRECSPDHTWLGRSKEAFDQALLVDPKASSAYYFMGECYLSALDLEAAGRMFSRVLELNAAFIGEAERRRNLIRKIEKAMPETVVGRKAALLEQLTRAEVAALFVEEMKIGSLLAQRTPKVSGGAFRDPGKRETAAVGQRAAKDIAGHPLRGPIEAIIEIGISGLDLYPDDTFLPDERVDRAGYAVMIEDILIKAAGDPAPATRLAGSLPPFPDLRERLPDAHPATAVAARGIREVRDAAMGSFEPLSPLSGADALLVIRNIRKDIRHWR